MNHIYQEEQFGQNWFTYPRLYTEMVTKFPSGSKFVEVGSWKGKSSAYMAVEIANSRKDINFYCVDHWLGSICLLYTSPSPRDLSTSRMPSSA